MTWAKCPKVYGGRWSERMVLHTDVEPPVTTEAAARGRGRGPGPIPQPDRLGPPAPRPVAMISLGVLIVALSLAAFSRRHQPADGSHHPGLQPGSDLQRRRPAARAPRRGQPVPPARRRARHRSRPVRPAARRRPATRSSSRSRRRRSRCSWASRSAPSPATPRAGSTALLGRLMDLILSFPLLLILLALSPVLVQRLQATFGLSGNTRRGRLPDPRAVPVRLALPRPRRPRTGAQPA